MRDPSWTPQQAKEKFDDYVKNQLATCNIAGLANALHAIQDSFSPAHKGFKAWEGFPLASSMAELIGNVSGLALHGIRDAPTPWNFPEMMQAKKATKSTISDWRNRCICRS